MSKDWNVSGLILEGICGTGKSALLHAILQSERFVRKPYLSAVVLSEHQTQRVLERKEREEGLTVADNLALLDRHVSYIESIYEQLEQMPWRRNGRTQMDTLVLDTTNADAETMVQQALDFWAID